MSNSNNEAVERACNAFQTSIDDLISKIQKRTRRRGLIRDEGEEESLRRECQRLVRHANHVLRTLTDKRTSLKHAIKAYGDASDHYIRKFSGLKDGEDDQRHVILREWFAIYLRLRDGFVLLESGERRHPHDGGGDAGVDAPSRLSDAYRRDGVTRKFSSRNGYTGAGYDEAYDEDAGVKRRLLDALSTMDGRWSPENVRDRTFDKDGNGCRTWEIQMDEHISQSKFLREDLNRIQRKFVNDVNEHLAATSRHHGRKGGGESDKLKLVTDDKSERISLGLIDIARQGNAFTINDAGGSLPSGMTVEDWRNKFGLAVQSSSQPPPKVEKPKVQKKRKFVLEDSSEEEEDIDVTYHKLPPPAQAKKKKQSKTTPDGLAVRVREAANPKNDDRTSSINEMKRQHGVSNAQLEQGREHLEEEQLRSKMAADDEDMREGFLGDGAIGRNGDGDLANHNQLLKKCLNLRTDLREAKMLGNDMDILWEAQEHWAAFDESLTRWKERFQALLLMRREIRDGLMDGCSDEAYTLRDNFREANIGLGNECIEIHEFFSKRLEEKKQMTCSTPSLPPLSLSQEVSLSEVCPSYLQFAEETFRTALNLVREHERCQPNSSLTNIKQPISSSWEKGQHFLLRGRAHHNIGRALYELAQFHEKNTPKKRQRQGGNQHESKDLLMKARKELDGAVLMAKLLRRNAVSILAHADAKDTSIQNNCSWIAEAMIHSLEAVKLESLSSGIHVVCSWKLDRMKEAEERFDNFFESAVASDVVKFASVDGVSHWDIAEALEDVYLFAARVAEMLTQSLESMPMMTKGWNVNKGEEMVQMACKAMKLAASASDQLIPFVERHYLDYETVNIATRSAIEEEESEICKWWVSTKAQSRIKLSDVVQSAGANDVRSASLQRMEVAGGLGVASSREAVPLPRRIFVQDGTLLQGSRSMSCRTRRVKKNNSDEDRAVTERFHTEFCTDNNNAGPGGSTLASLGTGRSNSTTVICRKWGDEVLEEHERKRCCPPLPDGISIDLQHALEKKLRSFLPTNNDQSQFTGFVNNL